MPQEIDYKVKFIEKYYSTKHCRWDIDCVDIVVCTKKMATPILYIESKGIISNEHGKRKALAQAVLTNKKQERPLTHCALIFADKSGLDHLIDIDCSDNSVLYNNDINWAKETPSNPTADAVARINDRIEGKLTEYIDGEITEYFKNLSSGKGTKINITSNNFTVIYNQWKNEVIFDREIKNEQDLINLYIVDILNGTKYENEAKELLFSVSFQIQGTEIDAYKIRELDGGRQIVFMYHGKKDGTWYIKNTDKYRAFWLKYKRPPEFNEFCNILEQSAKLYSDKYRRTTGGEYTPHCFVDLQNKKLRELGYNMDDFIVFDPCCGVGNLENDFGKDYKDNCYISTLEQMDVDICKMKGFENVIQFDFLKDSKFPKFKYKGTEREISEICALEHKKLMVIMNPPYQRTKDRKSDLAIEFYNKCVELNPQVIVYYFKTERFLSEDIKHYIKSGYKIQSHVMSNAKTTFLLSRWPISQVIFGKDTGVEIDENKFTVSRYELETSSNVLVPIKDYTYKINKENLLILNIDKTIKNNMNGAVLGQYNYLQDVLTVSNKSFGDGSNTITVNNLKYCLLSKGLNFNTHWKYFERNKYVYQGKVSEIPQETFNDAIMFSLFYIGNFFSNKMGNKNHIMPFTAEELCCNKNDLNVLINTQERTIFDTDEDFKPFDFRDFMKQFEFSKEARELYFAALEIFKYYHANPLYDHKDWNDSFYDVTNAIMGKDPTNFVDYDPKKDKRITKVKTTKGTKGFGRNTIKYAVEKQYLPIFEDFFNKRDILAKKINKQLVDSGLLLWERENIY